MKKFQFLFIFIITFHLANAQTYYTVTGKVWSNITSAPLENASVFAQNTTLGTVTDANGNFSLNLPNGGYDLAVSFSGYETEIRRVTTADGDGGKLNFTMNEKQKDLADVVIVATNEVKDGLEKYGQFFRDNFLGRTYNSNDCKILNDSILKFYYYRRSNKLKVMADEPLEIQNNSLGYNIRYALDSFVHEYGKETSIYTGNPLFTPMYTADTAVSITWERNRNFAYKGSTLHFMRSVYYKALANQNFEVQQLMDFDSHEKAYPFKNVYEGLHYIKYDSISTVEIYPNFSRIGILYKKAKPSNVYLATHPGEPKDFRFSILQFLNNEKITIEENGYYYEQNDLLLGGYWAWEKVADLLPYDFIPAD